jgi:hypothetical protein
MIETAIAQTQEAKPPTPTIQIELAASPVSDPEPTDVPLPSPTLSMVATVIAEPKPIFEYARIYGMGHLGTGHLLITIEVPGELTGSYQALVADEGFQCTVLPDYPNRLYCTGLTSYQGKYVQLKLIESRSQITVYQTVIGIPPSPAATQTVEMTAGKSNEDSPAQPTDFPEQPTPTPPLPAYPYP